MDIGGYSGEILHIDLTERKIKKEKINLDAAEKFLGGLGYNMKLAYDLMEVGVDPLSPENLLILGAGVLVGTFAPGASRVFATTKLPINNRIGWCGGGGMRFGCMLKNSGFDHVVIRGASETPVFLKIFDDDIEICDANSLWGKGIDETTKRLRDEFGNSTGVISIGQAGESLVKYSMAFVDQGSSFGRGGVAAVFGSKNLKAVISKGTKGVAVVHKKRFKKVCDDLYSRIRNYPLLREWQKFGLIMSLPFLPKDVYQDRLFKARMACIGCPIGDKDMLEIKTGKYKGYKTVSSSAVNSIVINYYSFGDFEECVKILGMLDDYGMDMFEFFAVLEFGKKLQKKGFLNDYPNANFEYTNENMTDWMRKIAYREELGDIFAEGINAIVEEFGEETRKFSPATSRNLSTYINPRGPLPWKLMGTMEFSQMIGLRGPHAAPGGSPTYFAHRPLDRFPRLMQKFGVPDDAIKKILPNMTELRVGRLLKYSYDNFMVLASLGICARAQINRFYYAGLYPELYSAATGMELSKQEMLKGGERIYNLMKLANIREGHNTRDKIPDKWLEIPRFKEYVGKKDSVTREMLDDMLDEYYDERGWNKKGIPTREKLEDLGLISELDVILNLI